MPTYLDGRIEILQGDITTLHVDAIVNAANKTLQGGGGVDGAIHRAAGPGLLEECKELGGADTGEAKITGGHELPARYVIHAVGPVWSGGDSGEDELLERCYRESLRLALENDCKTIAFPAISTGAYRFPLDRATKIAQRTAAAVLEKEPGLERVVFCCFGDEDFEVYRRLAEHDFEWRPSDVLED